MNNLKSVFKEEFKFDVTDIVRHRQQVSASYPEHGLFVLRRFVEEVVDDYGNRSYKKNYECRIMSDILTFNETELMSEDEYIHEKNQQEMKRRKIKLDIERTQGEVFEAFGVSYHSNNIYLQDEQGKPILEKKYRPIGFRTNEETKKFELMIQESGGIQMEREERFVDSPEKIILLRDHQLLGKKSNSYISDSENSYMSASESVSDGKGSIESPNAYKYEEDSLKDPEVTLH